MRGSWLLSRPGGWLIAIAVVVIFYLAWGFVPIGKPADSVQSMSFSPQYAKVHRTSIGAGSRANRPLLSFGRRSRRDYSPRSITLTSDGAVFRAFLLDLSDIDDTRQHVEAFMTATTEIEQGREPTTAPIEAKAVDVTEAHFDLGWQPSLPFLGDGPLDHMLVVACDAEAEVTVRVSYGR